MRYIFIFVITIILSLIILFYHPYLAVYKDYITINLDDDLEGYDWNYTLDNDNLKLVEKKDNTWKFKTNKKGLTNMYFTYTNNDDTKYTIYYKLKVKSNMIIWLEGYGEGLLNYPNPK